MVIVKLMISAALTIKKFRNCMDIVDLKGMRNMKYRTENEFEHFVFADAHIDRLECAGDMFHLYLDDAGILPENSCNRDIRKMRTNGLLLRIADMKIKSLTKEGYTYYDADGKFLKKEPDLRIDTKEYPAVFKNFADGYVVEAQKESGAANVYVFTVDSKDESTYVLVLKGSRDTEEWERFLSLEDY